MRLISSIVIAALVCGTAPVGADEIAFSMVHEKSRIDVPTGAITRIKTYPTYILVDPETRQRRHFPAPRVEVCYTAEIQERVCQLTSQIVEQATSLVVDCEVVSKPVVRERLCGPCLQISAYDLADANALAQRLRKSSNRQCAPVS